MNTPRQRVRCKECGQLHLVLIKKMCPRCARDNILQIPLFKKAPDVWHPEPPSGAR